MTSSVILSVGWTIYWGTGHPFVLKPYVLSLFAITVPVAVFLAWAEEHRGRERAETKSPDGHYEVLDSAFSGLKHEVDEVTRATETIAASTKTALESVGGYLTRSQSEILGTMDRISSAIVKMAEHAVDLKRKIALLEPRAQNNKKENEHYEKRNQEAI